MFVHSYGRVRAPEFGEKTKWVQGTPTTMRNLRGKVVLIDFWTYSCVNCIRTIPHLKRWNETYEKNGLVIIGVHTPEFAFEKNEENVKEAIRKFSITYPVILDDEYAIWKQYANRVWPRKFLINAEGVVVYDHAGEGAYAAIEMEIQEQLRKRGAENLPAIGPDASIGGRVCYRTTQETYFGYLRGKIENATDVLPGEEMACTDDEQKKNEGEVVLHGHWKMEGEYVEHTRDISGMREYLRIQYRAYGVNAVLEVAQSREAKIELTINGLPIAPDMRGEDVVDEQGKTVAYIKDARMYSLVKGKTYHEGSLRIATNQKGVRCYAATYASCEGEI